MLTNLGQDLRDRAKRALIIFIRAAAHPEANTGGTSIGYPDPVLRGRPIAEPYNLGRGFWCAFGCPVKVVNDTAMQALLS